MMFKIIAGIVALSATVTSVYANDAAMSTESNTVYGPVLINYEDKELTETPVEQKMSVSETAVKTKKNDIDKYLLIAHIGAIGDITTTIICLEKGTCYERNPLYGRHPSPAKIIAIRGGTQVAFHVLMKRLAEDRPGAAKAAAITWAVVSFAATGLNMRYVF